VTLYGLTAGPVARRLGLSEEDPQGVLIVGAQQVGREISQALKGLGFKTVLVDTNERNIEASRAAGLTVFYGNALSEEVIEDVDFAGIGRLLALTSNDEVNALATIHFGEVFDRSHMFQLSVEGKGNEEEPAPKHLRGRFLFDPRLNYKYLAGLLTAGWKIGAIAVTDSFDFDDFKRQKKEGKVYPLFLAREGKELMIFSAETQPVIIPGLTLVALVPPVETPPGWATWEYDHAVLQPGQFMGRGE
jgi:hypothetical protein